MLNSNDNLATRGPHQTGSERIHLVQKTYYRLQSHPIECRSKASEHLRGCE
jgi:hypothetical protein